MQVHSTIGDTPYCLLYGQNPCVGITDLPISRDLMEMLVTKAKLNTVAAYPAMVDVEDNHRVTLVRQGDESDEEETFSYMDELVMATEDSADIFGTEDENNEATEEINNAIIFGTEAENNDDRPAALVVNEKSVVVNEVN